MLSKIRLYRSKCVGSKIGENHDIGRLSRLPIFCIVWKCWFHMVPMDGSQFGICDIPNNFFMMAVILTRGRLGKKNMTMCGTGWILVACVMFNTRKASGCCQVRNALWCITSPPLVIKLPPLRRHFNVFGQKFTLHLPLIYPFGASSITLLDPPFPTGILIETFLVFKVEKWMPDQELTFAGSRKMVSACK